MKEQVMNILLTIKSLYAVNGVAAVLLYLPQIARAWKDRSHALSLSLVSFGGWSIGSFITALYAAFYVRDTMFMAISVGNMAGSGAVFLLAAKSRFPSFTKTGSLTAEESPIPTSPAGHEADNAAGLA